MSFTDCSSSTYEKEATLLGESRTFGTQKITYRPHEEFDFTLESSFSPIDLSLALPHYRARNQPVDHRLSMFVAAAAEPVKLRVCRNFPRSKFYLEVQAEASDVTLWLPSDFKGTIHHSGKASFSAGFVNRIMSNVHINEQIYHDTLHQDEIVVYTQGRVAFRMWDVTTCAPECAHKEALKRMFGCKKKAPETSIDWDFLLED